MTYELCKQLKDAGLEVLQHSYCNNCEYDSREGSYHVPTLSELIEACGDKFHALLARGNGGDDNWEARSEGQFGSRVTGSTPEEAVASLYLKLHEKN